MDLGLKNTRVAITGGSKGIGRAIAEGFAAEGANVSMRARSAADVTATVAERLGLRGGFRRRLLRRDQGRPDPLPKGLSRQLMARGIRVNCVSPGNTYFDGGIWQNIEKNMPDLFQSTLKVNPTGKFGTAQEVAHGVVFLSSPMASRISGTNLVIDGALTVAV